MTTLPTTPDTAIAQWAIVLGFLMPLVVSLVVQSHWASGFKATVSLLSCLAAATVQLGIQGRLDLSHLPATALGIMALSVSFHAHFWKPTGIAPWLEQATNLPVKEGGG